MIQQIFPTFPGSIPIFDILLDSQEILMLFTPKGDFDGVPASLTVNQPRKSQISTPTTQKADNHDTAGDSVVAGDGI